MGLEGLKSRINGAAQETRAIAPRPAAQPMTLAPRDIGTPLALMPQSADDLLRLGHMIIASGLAPKSLNKPESVAIVIMTGMELGLSPMQSMRGFYVVEGRATPSADLMVALCKRAPACRYFRCIETTVERATFETLRAGSPLPERMTFTMADAQRAGLAGKATWKSWPANMLRARAASALARSVYPDLVGGLYLRDEVESGDANDVDLLPAAVEDADAPAPLHRDDVFRVIADAAPDADEYLAARGKPSLYDLDDAALLAFAGYVESDDGRAAMARWRASRDAGPAASGEFVDDNQVSA